MASIKRIGKDKRGMTIWDVQYRRTANGRVVHRRIHAHTQREVEQQIALECERGEKSLRWSDGLKIYEEAKMKEGKNLEGIGHAVRAVAVFCQVIGDIFIEDTTSDILKNFMQQVSVGVTLKNSSGALYRTAGPSVSNHHRKELISIARYLLRYTDKLRSVPFEHTPSLPVQTKKRSPIPESKISLYMDALEPYVRRPVMMVLVYGLRSSAICNLSDECVSYGTLTALDKGGVERRIPVDEMLGGIVSDALEFRGSFPDAARRLFVNSRGLAWNRSSLLRAAQRLWEKAGLERKKIHEIRHTLGTLAGRDFSVGMVQAAMGHRSRQSSEVYFHPDEEMASEVRQKIVSKLFQTREIEVNNSPLGCMVVKGENGEFRCPHCQSKVLFPNE